MGLKPDHFTFCSALKACSALAALEQGKQIHIHVIQTGYELNVFVCNSLVDMYAKSGSIECAHSVFNRVPKADLALFSSFKLEDASGDPNLLKKLLSVLQAGDDFDCPVCLSPPSEAIITICSHVFCKKCIEKTLKHLKPQCPLCRKQLTTSDLLVHQRLLTRMKLHQKK